MPIKIPQGKRCKKCGKAIRDWNKSGLCSHHYRIKIKKMLRKKRREKGLCIDCGKKVEPIITYPAGDTIPPIKSYPSKCYKCRIRQRGYNKIQREKNKLKEENFTEDRRVVTTF